MSSIDWAVLVTTLFCIIVYGIYRSKTSRNLEGYFLGDRQMHWGLILLSIMGTQASAITFLSAPGQAYTDGMRFVQYYFGIPLAMVLLCIFFVPIFHKLKVYTAYEFLEQRFNSDTRSLTAFLFLLSRGLSTGLSVFAPSIILSSILGWNIYYTNIFMGGLLIIYTVSGGAKAVAYTQQLQLIIIFIGMFLAGYFVIIKLPNDMNFTDALEISGKLGKLNVITTGINNNGFDWSNQYNIWSGIIGGFFLALSYFGTDQSQVGRYLTAKSLKESRMGLIMNGFVKVPMQFAILLIGALVFSFYQFYKAPVFFNQTQLVKLENSIYNDSLHQLQRNFDSINTLKKNKASQIIAEKRVGKESSNTILDLKTLQLQSDSLRNKVKGWIKSNAIKGDDNDTNYIFLRFVMDNLPKGLIGLLIAIIFLASWGSIAAALNSLASSSMVDFHVRFSKRVLKPEQEYRLSKIYTLAWGIFCIIVAMFLYNLGNSLIEAVNVLGSLFYGVILGIFLIALFFKNIKSGKIVFYSALITEFIVISIFILSKLNFIKLAFLWLNPIGAITVILLASVIHKFKYK